MYLFDYFTSRNVNVIVKDSQQHSSSPNTVLQFPLSTRNIEPKRRRCNWKFSPQTIPSRATGRLGPLNLPWCKMGFQITATIDVNVIHWTVRRLRSVKHLLIIHKGVSGGQTLTFCLNSRWFTPSSTGISVRNKPIVSVYNAFFVLILATWKKRSPL